MRTPPRPQQRFAQHCQLRGCGPPGLSRLQSDPRRPTQLLLPQHVLRRQTRTAAPVPHGSAPARPPHGPAALRLSEGRSGAARDFPAGGGGGGGGGTAAAILPGVRELPLSPRESLRPRQRFVCGCRRGAGRSRSNSCHIICAGRKQPSRSPPLPFAT